MQAFARLLLATAVAVSVAACAGRDAHEAEPDAGDAIRAPASGFVRIEEAFVTAATPEDNIDSPTAWIAPDGRTWLIASAKETDLLVVYDGQTGARLRTVGGPGDAPGQFRRPNGVFAYADLLFVVERDNRRVQVLSLPDFAPLASFGEKELRQPYGLWLTETAPGEFEVLVSDNYMSPDDEDAPPPLAELGARIKRYRVVQDDNALRASFLGAFGDTGAAGAIRVTESLWGDPAHARLLIAEEDQATGTALREYGLDGRFRGRSIGLDDFRAQAEGIALWSCPDGDGYWIATDQYADRSLFHVYGRETLEHLGAFAGNTANTDGVWLHAASSPRFPAGVFYAVDDDRGVGAFDWRDIARGLKLRERCD